MWTSLLDALPRGYTLDEQDWQRRHRLLLRVLAVHVPGLAVVGAVFGHAPLTVVFAVAPPTLCALLGQQLRTRRRTASVLVTGGLVFSSAALVGLTGGAIEAHFHFFIIIGFIALYQDWAPFLFNIGFTVISHGIGSAWQQTLIFAHPAGQANPWLWSLIHGVAVLFACIGMTLFWRITEESQNEKDALSRRLAEAEIGRRQFTSDLLVNLARRNQSMLYRQLDIINQLEESERDPDALAELFKLDHLATRVRRNAESLLVLSGEQPPRTWSEPVPLRDVLRAAIAETEDLERVVFVVDERSAVAGHSVTDLTHLIAELTENAVRFSPPDTVVTIRARPDRQDPSGALLTVEDWGVGMPADELAATNALLAEPPEIDLSVSQRLGFHVVARLAARHDIRVSLSATPGSGITALIRMPSVLFTPAATQQTATQQAPAPVAPGRHEHRDQTMPVPAGGTGARAGGQHTAVATATRTGASPDPFPIPEQRLSAGNSWTGWWDPTADDGAPHPAPAPALPAAVAVPSPRPRPTVEHSVPQPHPQQAGGLRRRVPQASLAPELRNRAPEPSPAAVPQRSAEAASALSRYQASRKAALDDVEGQGGWRP